MKSHAGWLLENRIWQIIETISHGLWFPNRCGQIPALVGREPGQAASDGSWSAAYTTALCKGQLFTLDFPACVLCVWMIVGKVPMAMQAGVGLSTLGPPLSFWEARRLEVCSRNSLNEWKPGALLHSWFVRLVWSLRARCTMPMLYTGAGSKRWKKEELLLP